MYSRPIIQNWRKAVIIMVAIALAILGGTVVQQTKSEANTPSTTEVQKLAADIDSTVFEVALAATPKVHHKAIVVPDVLTRIGFTVNQGLHVVPVDWCRDHQTICMNELKDRFAKKAISDPSNNPPEHANANMKRVYLNSFDINPKECGALCSYNHYRDDVNRPGGYCQMGWKVVGGVSLGQPAWPECHEVAWGGPDGTDAGTNFDNVDRGFVVCAGTVLGTAAGEVVFGGPAAAPAAGITVGAGTFGCGVGWALGKWLF